MRTKKITKYKCPICNKASLFEIYEYDDEYYSSIPSYIECDNCDTRFSEIVLGENYKVKAYVIEKWTNKGIIIDGVDTSKCKHQHYGYCMIDLEERNDQIVKYNKCENNPDCSFKQLARAKEEIEELRQYHNKCCKENTEKSEQLLEKYNQVSRDFYNGKYCNRENCSLLKAKEQECKHWKSQCLCLDGEDVTVQITQKQFEEYHQCMQALEEIEKIINSFPDEGIPDVPQTQIECTQYFLDISETKVRKILDIIRRRNGLQ